MNTQSNTAKNPGTDTQETTKRSYGAPATSTALLMLFDQFATPDEYTFAKTIVPRKASPA